jgi:predicted  nucleic acid-binding Zn-ribbon protein
MQLNPLWELQEVDQSIEEISREIKQKDLVVKIKEKQKIINDIQLIIEKVEKEIDELEIKARKFEEDLLNLEAKKQAQEKKLYDGSCTNPKELESMKVKLDEIKEKIVQVEDQAITNMDILEDKVHIFNQESGRFAELKRAYNKDIKLYQKNKRELTDKMALAETKQAELLSMLEENLLSIYQRVQINFKNRGIARVENGICSGCRVEIPIMHLKNIKEGNNIYTCEQCGRILIWYDTKKDD